MPSSTVSLPKQQTAIVTLSKGKIAIKHDVPVPALTADMAIVKTAAVAINPVDPKMLDYSPRPGTIEGYDFAGTIVALGADAPKHFAVGDRVCGYVAGMNSLLPDVGAFAEYIGASADILLKIPDSMSFEEAAGLALSVATAGFGLFDELKVPGSLSEAQTDSDPHFVLVAGGSSSTGTRAINMLKLAGLRPIATASPSNFDFVAKFGAEKVFDYHSPTCAEDIRAYTGNNLAYAFDCVSMADTMRLCYDAMGRAGGRYVTLEPYREQIAVTRPTIAPSWVLLLTLFGRKVELDGAYARDAQPEHRVAGARLFADVQVWLDKGLVELHPFKSLPGGFEGVLDGVEIMRAEPPSGYKLVYLL